MITDLDPKWVRLAPKWDKSGTFSEQISVHFGAAQLHEELCITDVFSLTIIDIELTQTRDSPQQ